jgi:methylmalonyl-CoA mutase C-terminal domain/subunit
MSERGAPIRVLIAKPGLDGHDRGAKVVTKALMNAGMEVIYTGRHQTIAQIVASAIQEGIDVIGLSILSGSHLYYSERLIKALKEQGVADKLVVVGGCIPRHDVPALKNVGVDMIAPQGSSLSEIVNYIKKNARKAATSPRSIPRRDCADYAKLVANQVPGKLSVLRSNGVSDSTHGLT